MRPLREFWVLMALGLAQLCLTGLFQTMVPYAYLSYTADKDAGVATDLKKLQDLAASSDPSAMTTDDLEARSKVMAPLFERVPWVALGFLASIAIYPLLGRMAGRYLGRPEASGLLILFSAGIGQNPATIPMNLQYSGMGQIALPLPVVIGMILFQFVALAGGILSVPEVQKNHQERSVP